jgi:hypothetical protein
MQPAALHRGAGRRVVLRQQRRGVAHGRSREGVRRGLPPRRGGALQVESS